MILSLMSIFYPDKFPVGRCGVSRIIRVIKTEGLFLFPARDQPKAIIGFYPAIFRADEHPARELIARPDAISGIQLFAER